ncbi:MAG: PD-(D/E)XK nuclease family protein [Candidatus Adiutrix sp.]|jgi:hypothetical protein|nr:PD-(D/E)XK nuclease family protein [Candidatus Adiutrix sp.]
MTDPASEITALFFSPELIWLAPNELARSQLEHQLMAAARLEPEGRIFPRRLAPRLETFSSLETLLGLELPAAEIDPLIHAFILEPLARTAALTIWPESQNPGQKALDRLAEDLGDGLDRLIAGGLTWARVAELPPGPLGRLMADLGRQRDRELKLRGRLSRGGRRRELLKRLRGGARFRALDGVSEIACGWSSRLSPFETDFLLALAENLKLELKLNFPAWVLEEELEHGSGFDLLRTVRQLEASPAPGLSLSFETPGQGTAPPALAYAAEMLLAPPASRLADPPLPGDSLSLLRAPTAYLEAEEAARRVKASLAEGRPPEGLAVVVPDLETYGPYLDDLGRRFGLPFHFRRGETLLDQGPVRAVTDLLGLWSSDWERSRLMSLLRSPYFRFPGLDPDQIQALTLAAGITDQRAGGGFEENLPRLFDQSGPQGILAQKLAERLKDLKSMGRALDQAPDWPAFIRLFKESLNELGWPGDLQTAPERPDNIRGADLAAASALAEELEKLGRALKDPAAPRPGPARFSALFRRLMTDRRLNFDARAEGRVRVLNYYDLHGGRFDEIFLLGLNERIFPQTGPETRWWPEEFVKAAGAAENLGRPLWSEAASRYRQEELMLAGALAQARERIWLFYHAGDENGRAVLPSPLLALLRELWPAGTLNELDLPWRAAPPLSRAAGRDELWTALAGRPPELWPEKLRTAENLAALAALRRRRERWRRLKKGAAPGPSGARRWLGLRPGHLGRPLMTPDFLASFAECPLAFFSRWALGLEDDGRAADEWPRSSEGTLWHEVLEEFFRRRLGRNGEPGPPWPGEADFQQSREEILEILERAAQRAGRRDPLGRRPLWRIRRGRLPKLLSAWLEREMGREASRPFRLEWSFGGPEEDGFNPWELPLGHGESIFLRGRADRLDMKAGGEPSLKLIDYKLRAHSGLNFKPVDGRLSPKVWPLMCYALAASRAFNCPVSASFEILEAQGPSSSLTAPPSDSPIMALTARGGPDGPVESDEFNFPRLLIQTWREIEQGSYPPLQESGTACPCCPYSLLCPRLESEAESGGPES